jgi:salicylate hydroxylase
MESLIQDDSVVFVGTKPFDPGSLTNNIATTATSGDYGGGCSFAFADVRALYLSLWRTYKPKPLSYSNTKTHYDVPYSLHLYNETRRYYLQRVKKQMDNDRLDGTYIAGAGDDDNEWIRRYRERCTINWWLLEHDVDEKWQEVEPGLYDHLHFQFLGSIKYRKCQSRRHGNRSQVERLRI